MEDINFDEFIKEIDEAPIDVKVDSGNIETNTVDWAEQYDCYLRLPNAVSNAFAVMTNSQRLDACAKGWKFIFQLAKLPVPDGFPETVPPSFISRFKKGYNSGNFCRTIADVNRLLAYVGAVEFIPGLKNGVEIYWCNKANYESLPVLPGSPRVLSCIASFLSSKDRVVIAKEFPINFVNAVLTSNGAKWRGPGVFTKVIPTIPAICTLPHQAALFIGEKNCEVIARMLVDFDPDSARKIVSISSKTPSIFSNLISLYHNLFSIVARDAFGPLQVDRALASIYDGCGFYGALSGIPRWLAKPSTLKVQSPVSSIVSHKVLDFYDTIKWPKDCVMYAVTPQDLKNYADFTGQAPKAIVMPITAAIGGNKHLQYLSERVLYVTLRIVFAETPLLIIEPDDNPQFNTNSLGTNLANLEKEIIVCLLHTMKDMFSGRNYCLHYQIKPGKNYAPKVCDVEFTQITQPFYGTAKTYVDMDDSEKQMFAGTTHASEVIVNGKKVSHGGKGVVAINYPRVVPDFLQNHDKILKPGKWYSAAGTEVESLITRPDLFGQTGEVKAENNPDAPKQFIVVPEYRNGQLRYRTTTHLVPSVNDVKEYRRYLLREEHMLKEVEEALALDTLNTNNEDVMAKWNVSDTSLRENRATHMVSIENSKNDAEIATLKHMVAQIEQTLKDNFAIKEKLMQQNENAYNAELKRLETKLQQAIIKIGKEYPRKNEDSEDDLDLDEMA